MFSTSQTRRWLAIALLCVTAASATSACSQTASATSDIATPDGVTVVLGGAVGPSNATIWVNGTVHDYGNAHVTGLFIEDDTVYAAGRRGLLNRATLWENHEPRRIEGSGAAINGIWVEDSIPYIIGSTGFLDRATWWVGEDERFVIDEANATPRSLASKTATFGSPARSATRWRSPAGGKTGCGRNCRNPRPR